MEADGGRIFASRSHRLGVHIIAFKEGRQMQTNVDEIADGIYRLSTCVPEAAPGGFTFNRFLDADPL